MVVGELAELSNGQDLRADVVIVGSGPAGIMLAQRLAATDLDILLLESGGVGQQPRFAELNRVMASGIDWSDAQVRRRSSFHGAGSALWSHQQQPFGVRCRGLGGSSLAWAGKCAAFQDIDFEARSWVPNSGWPIGLQELNPYFLKAADALNLSPDIVRPDQGIANPAASLDQALLRPFGWQFAMSGADPSDRMRFGLGMLNRSGSNLRVAFNATVVEVLAENGGNAATGVAAMSEDGESYQIGARAVVLAASAIENPRLMLASQRGNPAGLGNAHDMVGRCLVDHPAALVGKFRLEDAKAAERCFGYFGRQHKGHSRLYQRGFVLARDIQEREGLTQAAAYLINEVQPAREQAGAGGLRTKAFAAARNLVASRAMPRWVKAAAVDAAIRFAPNIAVRRFRTRDGGGRNAPVNIEVIAEQTPERHNRVTLSAARDRFGVPVADVSWRVGDRARRAIWRTAKAMESEFARMGLPSPVLEDWVEQERLDEAVIIDMAHPMGTTRMARHPAEGVVDPDCRVHGMSGLYIAGSSVFPTGGHSNPTFMIVALALRLADTVRRDLEHVPVEISA